MNPIAEVTGEYAVGQNDAGECFFQFTGKMGVQGEVAVLDVTERGVDEVDADSVVVEVAVGDDDIGAVGEAHASFVVVVIACC